jgi:uncharacterized protein (DUF1810 family)
MDDKPPTPAEADPFDLRRFTQAQEGEYSSALAELKRGRKESHWIWFIFPQIDGLGHSPTSKYYAIKSLEETHQYLAHPVLGARLKVCCEAVLALPRQPISNIFGPPDDLKFRSSMTLFAEATGRDSIFTKLLDKFFDGQPDEKTLEILRRLSKENSC